MILPLWEWIAYGVIFGVIGLLVVWAKWDDRRSSRRQADWERERALNEEWTRPKR